MKYRISELQNKEVVNVADGTRYGYIADLEIDGKTGQTLFLVVSAKSRCTLLFAKNRDKIFHWSSIKRIGRDIILVDADKKDIVGLQDPSQSKYFL